MSEAETRLAYLKKVVADNRLSLTAKGLLLHLLMGETLNVVTDTNKDEVSVAFYQLASCGYIEANVKEDPIETYEEYLRSDHWQAVRKAALKRAGYRCQVCNVNAPLDVHHRTYERIGAEEDADVIAMCRGCHEMFHKQKGK